MPAGFAHGFPTRAGGRERAALREPELRPGPGATAARPCWRTAAGCWRRSGGERLFIMRQVHGTQVVQVEPGDTPEGLEGQQAGDAFVSDVPGAGLGVFSADCVPVLLADPTTGRLRRGPRRLAGRGRGRGRGHRGRAGGGLRRARRRPAGGAGPGHRPLLLRGGPRGGGGLRGPPPRRARAWASWSTAGGPRPHIDLKRSLRLELEALGVPAAQHRRRPRVHRLRSRRPLLLLPPRQHPHRPAPGRDHPGRPPAPTSP